MKSKRELDEFAKGIVCKKPENSATSTLEYITEDELPEGLED
jgi:hypothetical protein